MKSLFLALLMALYSSVVAGNEKHLELWVAQFSYTNGWGRFEVIWVNPDGRAGYANLGHSPALPCQFELTATDTEELVSSLNKAIRSPKMTPHLGQETMHCSDETRVSINVSHKPKEDGVLGFQKRMSMIAQCNDSDVDQNLFSVATIVYKYLEKLPSECKINPLKDSG